VLHSIANERKRFPLFVSRRLALIAKHTCIANWNHVPTKCNPADLLSRGCRASVLMKNEFWLTGPDFLKIKPSLWLARFKKVVLKDEEIERFDKRPVCSFLAADEPSPVDILIAFFSSLHKLKRATAWFLKFKRYLMSKVFREREILITCTLTLSDLQAAEIELIKYEQKQCFGEMLKRIPDGIQVSPKSPLGKLNPVLVDGMPDTL